MQGSCRDRRPRLSAIANKQIFVKQGANENLYGKMPCLARFRHGTTGHTMRPQSKTKCFGGEL